MFKAKMGFQEFRLFFFGEIATTDSNSVSVINPHANQACGSTNNCTNRGSNGKTHWRHNKHQRSNYRIGAHRRLGGLKEEFSPKIESLLRTSGQMTKENLSITFGSPNFRSAFTNLDFFYR